jgi:hypothetical protein
MAKELLHFAEAEGAAAFLKGLPGSQYANPYLRAYHKSIEDDREYGGGFAPRHRYLLKNSKKWFAGYDKAWRQAGKPKTPIPTNLGKPPRKRM